MATADPNGRFVAIDRKLYLQFFLIKHFLSHFSRRGLNNKSIFGFLVKFWPRENFYKNFPEPF